jgi:type II secretory pathway pseudopilin PulG
MSDDRGFTLPELMIATMMTLLMGLPAYLLLERGNEFAEATRSRLALNAQARQVWTLLGSGSANLSGVTSQKDADGFSYVEGMRSLAAAPTGNTLRNSGQFTLQDSPLSISGDAFPMQTVTCTGAANPIPDCVSTETHNVQGWLGSDPSISVSGRNASVLLTLTDPFEAQRANSAPSTATEQYRTIFTLNGEAAP